MVVRVIARHVTLAHDLAREGGKAAHMITHHEKRRGNALPRQCFQDRVGGSLIGTVIEGQIDSLLAWPALHRGPEQQIEPHHPVTRL